jgi:hypothetical protein
MLGRAQNGETLTITKIVVGSGVATDPSQLWPLTALIHQELDVTISSKRDFGTGTMLVEGNFRSDAAPHAFDLREVGVMAHVAAEADRLYSVANVFTDTPVHIDPAAPVITGFKIKLIIDRIPSANVVVQIGPSEAITGENIGADTVGPGFYKEAIGNVMRFKRAVQGDGMIVVDEGDTVRFAVQSQTLQNDLDLYVPLTYPNPPAGAPKFATVQQAHDYLLAFAIPTDKFARIHVAAGRFDALSINFTHPHCSQISLIGWTPETYNVSKIEWVSNTQKKITFPAGVNITNLVAGGIVYLKMCHASWSGGCRIISKSGQTVTCSILNRSGKPPYNVVQNFTAPNWAVLVRFPTVLHSTATAWGVGNINFPYGIQRVENITSEGGYACFNASAYSNFVNCMAIGLAASGPDGTAHGFSGGVMLGLWEDCVATDVSFGIGADNTIFAPTVTFINACGAGILGQNAYIAAITWPMPYQRTYCYITHCGHGARIWNNAHLSIGYGAFANNAIGVHLNVLGSFSSGPPGNIGVNNDWDLYAIGMSYAAWERGGFGAPHTSPAAGVYGQNDNSFVTVVNSGPP